MNHIFVNVFCPFNSSSNKDQVVNNNSSSLSMQTIDPSSNVKKLEKDTILIYL